MYSRERKLLVVPVNRSQVMLPSSFELHVGESNFTNLRTLVYTVDPMHAEGRKWFFFGSTVSSTCSRSGERAGKCALFSYSHQMLL